MDASKADTPEKGKEHMNSVNESRQEVQAVRRSPDFVCEYHGSLFLLFPRSAPAKTWVADHLPPDRMTFGDGIIVEPRYIWSILVGLQEDGLTAVRG